METSVLNTLLAPNSSLIPSDKGGEIDQAVFKQTNAFTINLNDVIRKQTADSDTLNAKMTWRSYQPSLSPTSVASLVDIMITAWQFSEKEGFFMCDLVYQGSDGTEKTSRCEAKVSRLESNTLLCVISDITLRLRRFEAEKLAIAEVTARKKDADANRFTKHEVKTGLLSCLCLCELLLEPPNDERKEDPVLNQRQIVELERSLNEVLDTVLAEAMARDVVHEAYEPQMEQ